MTAAGGDVQSDIRRGEVHDEVEGGEMEAEKGGKLALRFTARDGFISESIF